MILVFEVSGLDLFPCLIAWQRGCATIYHMEYSCKRDTVHHKSYGLDSGFNTDKSLIAASLPHAS